MSRALLVLVLFGITGVVEASPPRRGSYRVVPAAPHAAGVPPTVFLNRCAGGCTVQPGTVDDARTHTSTIVPGGGMFTIAAFQWGDPEWDQILACVKQVFSPYAITITDVQPPTTAHYGEAIVAGIPGEIGVSNEFGGMAPLAADCGTVDYPMSFTFANAFTFAATRVHDLCWVAAQEIGHTYGLDHEYAFLDETSACSDPMTYRTDCGGQRFFRNRFAVCGEFAPRDCRCGPKQTSHGLLSVVLGPGTPTTRPTVSISSPVDGSTIPDGTTLHVPASAERGVTKLQVLLNGYQWFEAEGLPFGPLGQPANDYTFTLPADVPDGVIDLVAIASDDLEITGMATVTVTKGAACESAASCAEGQQCEAGRCFWDPPTGAVGDACTYPQFCESARCDTVDGESFCTETCNPTATGICGPGLECRATSELVGFCWPPATDSGCCSSGRDSTPWAPLMLGATLVFVLRRRRS